MNNSKPFFATVVVLPIECNFWLEWSHRCYRGVKITAVGSSADLQSIEWVDLSAGSTATRQISVTNNGAIPTTLSMSAGDWVPLIALQYLTITWNYASGTVLQAGASQTITLTINVNQYVTGINTFTNTIYIIATQSS